MFEHWQFQEAKNKLSEVINLALKKGAQIITRRGEEVAVILSFSDYQKLQKSRSSLTSFFHDSPLNTLDLSQGVIHSTSLEEK
jgi:prevent-host-death family protein